MTSPAPFVHAHSGKVGPKVEQRQRGIALIAVLLLLVFVLTIVGGMFYRHQIHIQKVTRNLVGEQALLLLLSAESWASSLLKEDGDTTRVDDYSEKWGQALPALPVEGGYIAGCVRDLQSRYNLNNLAGYSNKSWEDEVTAEQLGDDKGTRRTIFKNLLALLQLDNSNARIAALVDWVDADSWLVSPESAEDNEYLLLSPAYRAANHPLVELSELNLVQGFDGGDVVALEPYLSALPTETTVNVNTASMVVMTAMLPQMTPEIYSYIEDARPFETPQQFYTLLANMMGETIASLERQLPPDFIGVGSDYFELVANVELAGVRVAYSSVLHRTGGDDPRVVQRTVKYIPKVVSDKGEALSVTGSCRQIQDQEDPQP